MSTSIEQMRAAVSKLYTGDSWRSKVAKMTESQIIAIYLRQVLGKTK